MTFQDTATAGVAARIDHRETAWDQIACATYIVRQTVRYEYSLPVSHLHQRLMLIPPALHGNQERVGWLIDTSIPAHRHTSTDRFGNVCVDFRVDRIDESIAFDSHVVLQRSLQKESWAPPPHRSLARQSRLTTASGEMAEVGADLVGAGHKGLDLAERVCDWTARRLVYRFGVTSVATTASEACDAGFGVCQDFAHVMLAVCRQAGLVARYVSGHLLGEGPSHAWVEVLLPNEAGRGWTAIAFDPTHGRRAGATYLTVATGRDYRDVAPVSGRCFSAQPGVLHTTKDAFVTSVE
ncbi:MAG: transglutaminase family protein [Acidimicrobiales bacterium]